MAESLSPKSNLARAGEGGGLPKGLSLFRFVFFSFLMLGSLYGGVSLYADSPPPPGDVPPRGISAARWQPSPLWLPSFVVLKLGIGGSHSPQGYVFESRGGYALYAGASVVFGMAIFGAIGWIVAERIRRLAVASQNAKVKMQK